MYLHNYLVVVVVVVVTVMANLVGASLVQQPHTTDESCDPVVDMLFVLEKSANITEAQFQSQKDFVTSLLKKHKSPKGAARVAVLVCDVNAITSTHFTEDFDQPFRYLEDNSSVKGNTNTESCLRSINLKMKTEARDGVTRIAILLKGSWNWEDIRSQNEAAVARQDGTILVVIAIGVREFDSLSSLQTIALREETFFVVSGYEKLTTLSESLAKDPCQPISLDLTSEKKVTINTTKQPVVKRDPCIPVGPSTFKKFVPGFGYTRQRCTKDQTFDLASCSCLHKTS